MDNFEEYLNTIEDDLHRNRLIEVMEWVITNYPEMKTRVAWKQPMFTDHDTFIIAFSHSKKHMSIAPEHITIDYFSEDIINAGYEYSKEIIKIKWTDTINYKLIKKIIDYNLVEKKLCNTFWRK